jgi:hypothetical protein
LSHPILPAKTDQLREAAQSHASQDPFDVWFRAGSREILGVDIEDGVPAPELLLDFDTVTSAS